MQFLACCAAMARREPPRLCLANSEVDSFLGLIDAHGVVPRIASSAAEGERLPPLLLEKWKARSYAAAAARLVARRQLDELTQRLHDAGVPAIALKGTSVMSWLYEPGEERWIRDLDLMVPESCVDSARRVLELLGYASCLPSESPEGERRRLWIGHLPGFVRAGSFPVEIHVQFLKDRGNMRLAMEEAWLEARSPNGVGAGLRHLSAEHFFLHTAAHSMSDLERSGFCPLKGLVDLLMLIERRGEQLNWTSLWRTAKRWRIFSEAATIAATLNECWDTGIPAPAGYPPLPRSVLLHGERGFRRPSEAVRRRHLVAALRVPGHGNRAKELLRLAFPDPPESNDTRGAALGSFYLRRLGALPGRGLGIGGWIIRRAIRRRFRPTSSRSD